MMFQNSRTFHGMTLWCRPTSSVGLARCRSFTTCKSSTHTSPLKSPAMRGPLVFEGVDRFGQHPFSYCRSPNKLNMRGGISSPSISWWVSIAFSQRWRNLQSRMPYFCSGYQRKSWLETTPLTDKSIMNNLPIWRQSLQGIRIMPSVPLHVCVCICASYPFTM